MRSIKCKETQLFSGASSSYVSATCVSVGTFGVFVSSRVSSKVGILLCENIGYGELPVSSTVCI